MRVLDIRAWDAHKKIMVYVDQNTPKIYDMELGERIDVKVWIVGNHLGNSLMLYTGFKDKNGKEIFEGDIVVFYISMFTQPLLKFHHKSVRHLISFKQGCFGFMPLFPESLHVDDREWTPLYRHNNREIWSFDYFEVIGNIYETPELLT